MGWPPGVVEDLRVGTQRGHQHPVERRQAVDDDEDDADDRQHLGPGVFLMVGLLVEGPRRSCSYGAHDAASLLAAACTALAFCGARRPPGRPPETKVVAFIFLCLCSSPTRSAPRILMNANAMMNT